MHLWQSFTENIEIGAVRIDGQDGLEVVTSDGGLEVRNLRSSDEARRWEISLPMVDIEANTTDYDSARQMWADTLRGLYSFNFHCFVDDEDFKARFDSPFQVTAPAGHLRHIDTFSIKEVLEESPDLTVAPVISGTEEVGETLSVTTGTWSGTPTYAYQWTRDGVEISGATAANYTLVLADDGAMIGCQVSATEDGTTRYDAAEVGPIAP